jgi:hypothetical protein
MKNRRNYYRILHIQPDAPQAIIQASYKALMRELRVHPDLGGDHWNATVVNEAYEVLRDPKRRADYDRRLFEHYTKQSFDTDRKPVITYFCPFCKRPLARQATLEETCPSCRSPLASSRDRRSLQEQRAVERVRKSGQVQIYKDWPLKPLVGDIIDLSVHGMRFQCGERLLPKTTIKLSSRDLKAVAVVHHTQKIIARGSIRYAVGVEFLTVQFSQPKGSFYSASV